MSAGCGVVRFGTVPQRRQGAEVAADDRLQLAATDQQRAEGDLLLRDDLVVAGLRFVGVDDGLGADLELALGLLQLFQRRLLCSIERNQLVACRQHIEVRGGHAQRQVLRRLLQSQVGRHHGNLGLLERLPVLRAVHRHGEVHAATVDAIGVADIRFGRVVAVDVCASRQSEVGQQAGAGLRDAFLRCLLLVARGGVGGIVGERLAIDLQQVVLGHASRRLDQLLRVRGRSRYLRKGRLARGQGQRRCARQCCSDRPQRKRAGRKVHGVLQLQ